MNTSVIENQMHYSMLEWRETTSKSDANQQGCEKSFHTNIGF